MPLTTICPFIILRGPGHDCCVLPVAILRRLRPESLCEGRRKLDDEACEASPPDAAARRCDDNQLPKVVGNAGAQWFRLWRRG